jgi:hypothetical protein
MHKTVFFKNNFLVLIAFVLILLPMCATPPKEVDTAERAREAARESFTELEGRGEEKPAWVNRYPVDHDYYIGVGQANDTGNPSEDKERARLTAFNEIAQGIKVKIEGEVTDKRKEELGIYSQEVQISIKAIVDITLQEVELVDTYYSKEDGYWFYYRLSKEKWDIIQQEMIRQIKERVIALVSPTVKDLSATVESKIQVLSKGIEMLRDSGFAGTVKAELEGREGYLFDLMILKREALVSSLLVEVAPGELTVGPGALKTLKINVVADNNERTGVIPVVICQDKIGVIEKLYTDSEGIFSGNIDFSILPFGVSSTRASLNLEELGFQDNEMKHINIPGADFYIERRPLTASLRVVVMDTIKLAGLYDSVKSVFSFLEISSDLPLQFMEKGEDSDFVLGFDLYFRDAPENEWDIFITWAKAGISIIKDEKSIMNYETQEIKGAGLNFEQAKQRATNALMKILKDDQKLQERVSNTLITVY